jgi:WD40 repeat protein
MFIAATLTDILRAYSSQGQGEATPFTQLVYDTYRFIMYHKQAIENSPLQVYGSALLFSPRQSLVRRLFQHEEPKGLALKPGMSDEWSGCLQTLEGHGSVVWSVAFSHNSTRLASASRDKTVKIWDASSGACLQTIKGHSSIIYSVAFSHNSTRLASASKDRTVKIWDASSGACLQTLEDHSDWVRSVVFSHDSTRLASASRDETVKIWDASSGACLQTLEGHSSAVYSVAFSHDSTRLASASKDRTVKIWDASSGACLQTLKVGKSLRSLSFDATSSCLFTKIGSIDVSASMGSRIENVTVLQRPKYLSAGVSLDNKWITCNGKNVLWIPSEYRPLYSSVCRDRIGIGVRSGRVWICSVNIQMLSQLYL